MSGMGQRIGYVRVSSYDQNPDPQLEQLDVERVGSAVWVGLGGGHGGSY
jgi:hypothetical protein